jgi:hypothetical protein
MDALSPFVFAIVFRQINERLWSQCHGDSVNLECSAHTQNQGLITVTPCGQLSLICCP